MENLNDYSIYVNAAYIVTGLVLSALMMVVVVKYLVIRSKNKNEKSA